VRSSDCTSSYLGVGGFDSLFNDTLSAVRFSVAFLGPLDQATIALKWAIIFLSVDATVHTCS
jgi:hypothetical protein